MKTAEVAEAGTTTEEGTAKTAELLVRAIVVLLVTAAAVLTVHVVLIPEVRVVFPQVSAVTTDAISMVPPVAEIGSGSPVGELADTEPTPMEAPVKPAATVADTLAITPFAMIFALRPEATHVKVPPVPLQSTVLPAAVAAGPAVTARANPVEGYESVH